MENIGGQAVIEGVMMKSLYGWTVAVRSKDGSIHLKKEITKNLPKILKLPIIRGVVALVVALRIGIRAIEFSGNVAFEEEKDDSNETWLFALSLVAAVLLALALFKFLPLYITTVLSTLMPIVQESPLLFNLIDGVLRTAFFLIYLFAIGLWGEMRKIYQYHGAEHKVIFAYEAGEKLTVENAKKYRPYHPRCGTSFLLIVMLISMMVFFLIPQDWSFTGKLLSRIILIPLIAGLSYEVLKLSARYHNKGLWGIMTLPGLWLQRLTVREPDDRQIEVALKALTEVLTINNHQEATGNVR